MPSELNARQRVLYERAIQRGIDDGVFTPNQDPGAIAAIALCMEDALPVCDAGIRERHETGAA
jgi:hypothetical protein